MIIDLMVYGLLKVLSWVLGWIPGLPSWAIDASYEVREFIQTVAEWVSPMMAIFPMAAIRPIFLVTVTTLIILWLAGIVHRFVIWMKAGESTGSS